MEMRGNEWPVVSRCAVWDACSDCWLSAGDNSVTKLQGAGCCYSNSTAAFDEPRPHTSCFPLEFSARRCFPPSQDELWDEDACMIWSSDQRPISTYRLAPVHRDLCRIDVDGVTRSSHSHSRRVWEGLWLECI